MSKNKKKIIKNKPGKKNMAAVTYVGGLYRNCIIWYFLHLRNNQTPSPQKNELPLIWYAPCNRFIISWPAKTRKLSLIHGRYQNIFLNDMYKDSKKIRRKLLVMFIQDTEGMLLFQVAFWLLSNINQWACSTLDLTTNQISI